MVLLLVILILADTLPSNKAISTDDCGQSKGCFRIPEGCHLPNCSYFATYRKQEDTVTFEVVGTDADWVSIGFNENQAMKGTHAVFCYQNNSKVFIGSGKITEYKLPDISEEPGLKIINESTVDNSIMCRFHYPFRPSISSNLRSLETNFYLIFAKGSNNAGKLVYHGDKQVNRGFSAMLINISQIAVPKLDMIISTDDCGKSKGCFRIPEGCHLSNCSYLATYRRQEDTVTFEVVGRNVDWVSIGFNENQAMKGTQAVFCYKNNSKVFIGSGKIIEYKLPDISEEPGLKLINESTVNNAIMCRFHHPFRPNSSSNLRSLETNFYLIFAKGSNNGGNLVYHGKKQVDRGFSAMMINVSQINVSKSDTETKVNTTDKECGKTIGCLRYPSGCAFSQCSYLATYKTVGSQVTFELSGTNADWVSIGFNDRQRMVDTDSVLCYKSNGNVILRRGLLTSKSLPGLTKINELKYINGSTEGSSIRCSFSRPLNSSVLVNLEDTALYFIYAKGKLQSSGDPGYHGGGQSNRGFSSERINIRSTTESTVEAPSDLNKRVHGSLMVVIWIFIASTGLFFARYTRDSWADAKLFGKKIWFQFHRLLMVTVVLGTISSVVVIFVDLDGFTQGEDKFKTHAILGLVVLVLATMQPIGALLRPHPGTPKRPIFNFFHRSFGVSAFIISIAAIILGLDIFGKDKAFYAVVGYAAFLGVLVIIMEIVKVVYEREKQESTTEVVPGGMEVEKPIGEIIHGFLAFSKIVLVIVLGISLGIVVLVIYLINRDSEDM